MGGVERYVVDADARTLLHLHRAQNAGVARRLGALGLVGCAVLAVALLAVIGGGVPSPAALLTVGMGLVLLVAFFAWMCTGRVATFQGRRHLVDGWFSRRGDVDPRGVPARRLRATYEVRLCDLGFEEVSPRGVVTRTAWRELEPDPVRVPEGVCFVLAGLRRGPGDAVGQRRASRGRRLVDRVEGILLVPREVVAARPGLVEEVAAHIGEWAEDAAPASAGEVGAWLAGPRPSGGTAGGDGPRGVAAADGPRGA